MRSTPSPIGSIPTELLCEIFVRCLPKTSITAPINVSHAYEAPLLLCQVSSKWRRAAVAFPPLWRALALQASYVFDNTTTKLVTTIHPSVACIVNSWFSRAGNYPLSLGLDLLCQNENDVEFELTLKLEEMLDRLPASRLQHLSLSALWPSYIYVLSNISQEFTELESIVLQAASETDSTHVPHRLLQSAPRLQSAELYNFIQPSNFPTSFIPWSQLTHLRVEGLLGEGVWYILVCHCKNLQHGIFSIERSDTRAPAVILDSDHEIILPHLVDLSIQIAEQGDKPSFRQLVFPVLRRLQLLFKPQPYNSPLLWDDNLPATVSNSLGRLVMVGSIHLSEPGLHLFLPSLSSITELHLSVEMDYPNFFKTLTFSSTTRPLLPKLEVLQCEIRNIMDAGPLLRSIISFVGSRWDEPLSTFPTNHGVTRLRRLTLKFHGNIDRGELMNQINHLLAPFRNHGLSLGLATCSGAFPNLREMMRYEPEI